MSSTQKISGEEDVASKTTRETPLSAYPYQTFVILALLLLAFFPSLFVSLLKLPFSIFGYLIPHSTIPPASPPVCSCCPCAIPQSSPTLALPNTMSWFQKTFTLPSRSRGSYLVTDHIEQQLPELKEYKVGLLNLFVQHTSCALSLNENWDEEVREDMSDALDRLVPEDRKGTLYRHSAEGPDDMPAHIKTALIGASVTIPINDGKLATGTWQGIWYLEFRSGRHSRKVVATIQGEKK